MRNILRRHGLLLIITSIAFLESCTGVRSRMFVQGKSPFRSWDYHLMFQRNDLLELGSVSDSLHYTTYFGLIHTNKDYRYTKRIMYPGIGGHLFQGFNGHGYISRVLYSLHEKQPDADIIIPVKVITKKQKMFLGSRKTITVIGKAYKFK